MIEVVVRGCCGRFGRVLTEAVAKAEDMHLFAGVDRAHTGESGVYPNLQSLPDGAEVILDATHHGAVGEVLTYARERRIPCVIATTGFTEQEWAEIREASKVVPVLQSANLSVGLAMLREFATRAAKSFPEGDVEIVECHRRGKQDAPSGTAKQLAEEIAAVRGGGDIQYGRRGDAPGKKGEIGVHSLRMGETAGEHTVILTTANQQLVLRHTALDRSPFAEGALRAIRYVYRQKTGFYTMTDLCGERICD